MTVLKRHSLHTFPPLSAVCLQAPAAGSVRRFGSLSGGRGRHRGPTGELVQPGGESVQQGGRLGHLYHLQRQWMWHLRRKEKEEQEEEEEEETSERQSDINESYSACHESDKHTHTHTNPQKYTDAKSWGELIWDLIRDCASLFRPVHLCLRFTHAWKRTENISRTNLYKNALRKNIVKKRKERKLNIKKT